MMITWLLEENTISQSAIRVRYVLGLPLGTDHHGPSANKGFLKRLSENYLLGVWFLVIIAPPGGVTFRSRSLTQVFWVQRSGFSVQGCLSSNAEPGTLNPERRMIRPPMPSLKCLFIIQGEGRGHMTQALALLPVLADGAARRKLDELVAASRASGKGGRVA